MRKTKTDEMIQVHLARERIQDKVLAKQFAEACESGDREKFFEAVDLINDCGVDAWRLALKRASRLSDISRNIMHAFGQVWVESKSLRRQAGDDLATVKALRRLMPAYAGGKLTLYRGCSFAEHQKKAYGLSWTSELEVAREFAEGSVGKRKGVTVCTVASKKAIIATTHAMGDHYNEKEYLVDRRHLGAVLLC